MSPPLATSRSSGRLGWLSTLGFALALGCGGAATPHTPAASGAGGGAGMRAGESGTGGSAGNAGRGAGGTVSAGAGAGATAGSAGRAGASGAAGTRAGAGGGGAGGTSQAGASGTTGAGAGGAIAPTGTPHVYVSGYGPDITHFTLDPASGMLDEVSSTTVNDSPSYLAIAADVRALYAITEVQGSEAVAFAIDPEDGALSEINRAETMGEGSPHLAVHPSGDWIAVAHYGSGHTSVLPVRADRGVMAPSDVDRGPNDGCRKAHQAVFDKSGRTLLVPCLESNYVVQFRFADGQLEYNDPPTVAVAGGPRHLALSPDERHAYVLSELESTITSFDFDPATGKLSNPQTIPSHDGTKGSSAHIVVHPEGRFLYASNRTENSIGLFSIGGDGRPQPVAFVRDMISTPRDFTVDPSGTFLISANQNGAENLLVFRIAEDGRLSRVRTVAVGGRPSFVGVALLP